MVDKKELAEWSIHYFRSRDAVKKEIVDVKQDSDNFDIVFVKKDKKQFVDVRPVLPGMNGFFDKLTKGPDQYTLVVLNKRPNLELLKKHWKEFIEFPTLSVVFVNPDSNLEKKWIINPYVHHRISDPNSLSRGLDSMFEQVEEIA